MAKHEFKNTKDVTFKFIEQLFKDSYQDKKAKVIGVIRAKQPGKPWRDITNTKSPARSVSDLAKEEYSDVRLVVRANGEPAYMNVPIKELHVNYKYRKPRKS